METPTNHHDPEVNSALVRLCDALCTYERITGRTSALILKERGGFVFRAASGKPLTFDVSDDLLIRAETADE